MHHRRPQLRRHLCTSLSSPVTRSDVLFRHGRLRKPRHTGQRQVLRRAAELHRDGRQPCWARLRDANPTDRLACLYFSHELSHHGVKGDEGRGAQVKGARIPNGGGYTVLLPVAHVHIWHRAASGRQLVVLRGFCLCWRWHGRVFPFWRSHSLVWAMARETE